MVGPALQLELVYEPLQLLGLLRNIVGSYSGFLDLGAVMVCQLVQTQHVVAYLPVAAVCSSAAVAREPVDWDERFPTLCDISFEVDCSSLADEES